MTNSTESTEQMLVRSATSPSSAAPAEDPHYARRLWILALGCGGDVGAEMPRELDG